MDESAQTEPPSKRMRLAYHHRHRPQYPPQKLPPHEPSVLPDESITKILVDSIKTICQEQAAALGIDYPSIESVALETLRNATEEFIMKVCETIRRSMLAARRTCPVASDFETAIDILSIPRPDDQLSPYKTIHEVNPQLLPTPPPDDPFYNHVELDAEFLGPELSKQNDLRQLSFNTSGLPQLPSAHTYKNSEVYTPRETDTRKIRELATEEGKLGEQALRKLAGAVRLDSALAAGPDSQLIRAPRGPRRRHPAPTEEVVFEETMRDLLRNEPGEFELGPTVTSEKGYRMPDEAQIKRRPVTKAKASPPKPVAVADSGPPSKYNLLPPPRKVTPAQRSQAERQDVSFEL